MASWMYVLNAIFFKFLQNPNIFTFLSINRYERKKNLPLAIEAFRKSLSLFFHFRNILLIVKEDGSFK